MIRRLRPGDEELHVALAERFKQRAPTLEQARRFLADERQVLATGALLCNRLEAQTGVDDGGSERWLLTSKAPVRDATGRVVGLVGSAKDVTEERRAEELESYLRAPVRV